MILNWALLFVFFYRSAEPSTKQKRSTKELSRAVDVSNLSWTPVEEYVIEIRINFTIQSEILLHRAWTVVYPLYQSEFVLQFSIIARTSVLSLSLRTPRSTPVKLSSAAMVSIFMNWFSRMAEPTALSDS